LFLQLSFCFMRFRSGNRGSVQADRKNNWSMENKNEKMALRHRHSLHDILFRKVAVSLTLDPPFTRGFTIPENEPPEACSYLLLALSEKSIGNLFLFVHRKFWSGKTPFDGTWVSISSSGNTFDKWSDG
jgi:hypothetical protein